MIRALGGFAILLAAGTLHAQPRHEFTELHMGLAVRIALHADDPAAARTAARAAFSRIAQLEDVFSDYRPESELRRLARRATEVPGAWVRVSPELFRVLSLAREVARQSGGAYDPTIAPLVALWRQARASGRLPDPARLDSARALVGWERLALDSATGAVRLVPGTQLDLGGVAKGYILAEALRVTGEHGVRSAMLDAGGDLVLGEPPPGQAGWRVDFGERGVELLARVAVATSGTGEQFVEIAGTRYAHLVDPRTGLGLTASRRVTVVGPDAATADALATAVVLLGPSHGAALLSRFPDYRVSL